jgi:peroxiredoxin
MAPDVPLTDWEGKRRSLKDFRGKLVLVNFRATWCRPCVVEMPELDRLHVAFKDRGFVVVAISTDVQGPEHVRKCIAEKGFRFPAFSGPDGVRAGIPFRLVGVPASYLVGPEGALLGSVAGPRSWAGAEAMALIGALLDAAGHRGARAPEVERQTHSSERGK